MNFTAFSIRLISICRSFPLSVVSVSVGAIASAVSERCFACAIGATTDDRIIDQLLRRAPPRGGPTRDPPRLARRAGSPR